MSASARARDEPRPGYRDGHVGPEVAVSRLSWNLDVTSGTIGSGTAEGATGVAVQQVERGNWPNGQAVPMAVIALEPPELAGRLRMRFRRRLEEFDMVESALIQLSSGVRVELVRQVNNPFPGTQLWVEESLDPEDVIAEFLADAGLPGESITWRIGKGRLV